MVEKYGDLQKPIIYSAPNIDQHGKVTGFHAETYPIQKPLTDTRLAGLPLAERANHLKGMILGNWQFYVQETYPHMFIDPPKPGEKRETAPKPKIPEAMLLQCILLDLNWNTDRVNEANVRVAAAETNYRQTRNEIKEGKLGNKRIPIKLEAHRKTWDPILKTERTNLATQETLRLTDIDIFIHEFFISPNGPTRLSLAIQELAVNTGISKERIDALLEEAKKRLDTAKGEEYVQYFGYKQGSDNLSTPEAMNVLHQNIIFGMNKDDPKRHPIDRQIGEVSEKVLGFYTRNIDHLYPPVEQTPAIALFYDVCIAAGLNLDRKLFFQVGDWLLKHDKLMDKLRREYFPMYQSMVKEEADAFVRLTDLTKDEEPKAATDLGYKMDTESDEEKERISDTTNMRVSAVWEQENQKRYIIGTNFDRFMSLESTFNLLASENRPNIYYEMAHKTTVDRPRQLAELEAFRKLYNQPMLMWRKYIAMYNPGIYLLDTSASAMMDKAQYLKEIGQLLDVSAKDLADKDWHIRHFQETKSIFMDDATLIYGTNGFLLTTLAESAPNTASEILDLQDINEDSIQKIRRNMHFVAVNGDRFSGYNDLQLQSLGIDSLTLYPDSQIPGGGWKATCTTSIYGAENPVQVAIFIDRKGKLYYGNRQPLMTPVWLYAQTQKIILDRLGFITSGQADKKPKTGKTKESSIRSESGERKTTRPEWRYLRPNVSGIQYTMDSNDVREHAKEVLDTYGIDIWEEIQERRKWPLEKGGLKANEFVTFVRPDKKVSPRDPPNEVKLD